MQNMSGHMVTKQDLRELESRILGRIAIMLIAGIGTLIQLYPVWRIGSRLPVVMVLSFTFLSAMMTLAPVCRRS